MLACLPAGRSILFAILPGMVLFCGLSLRRGFSMTWKKGRGALIAAAVLLSIGILPALWRTSGAIARFLYLLPLCCLAAKRWPYPQKERCRAV